MSRESSNNEEPQRLVKEPDSVGASQQNLQSSMEWLMHACKCREANCQPSCRSQKRVLAHVKVCKSRKDCPICRNLVALCFQHAKQCEETECSMFYCSSTKLKLQQQWQKQQQQQHELLWRRMPYGSIKVRSPTAMPDPPPKPAPPAKPAQPAPQLVLIQNLQSCLETLVHACQCSDANCEPSCQSQKRILAHAKVCKSNIDCPICQNLVTLCYHHAKQCQETKCSVFYCSSFKVKLQQQWHKEQHELLCRRMAAMKMRSTSPKPAPPAKPATPAPPAKPATPAQPASQLVLIQHQRTVVPPQQQQRRALQQLMTALGSPASPSQQQEILKILKSNPALVIEFIKHREQNAQNQQQGGDGVSVGNDGVVNVGVDGVGFVDVGVYGVVNEGVDGEGNVDVGVDGVQQQPQ